MKEKDIYDYLKENGIYAEVYFAGEIVVVCIDWGDWKHEHGYADYLMGQKGYTCIQREVTEEDGSDCYSANHYYAIV